MRCAGKLRRTETNRFRDSLDSKLVQGEISATWPDHRYGCRLTILKRIVVEDTLERSDQVLSVVSIDAELDGHAIDDQAHLLGRPKLSPCDDTPLLYLDTERRCRRASDGPQWIIQG